MIYIILPVYNESQSIPLVISRLRTTLKKFKYKIICVNDGSSDNSLAILNKLIASDLTVVSYSLNMNIGSVFANGLSEALRFSQDDDIVIIMEADNTSSVDLIHSLIKPIIIDKKDIVIASRYVTGGSYKNFPFNRQLTSYLANAFMKLLFPIENVKDYTIFFRGYRMGILKKAQKIFGNFGLVQSKGFLANAELLVKLSCLTDKIYEVPFVYDYGRKKGGSKLKILTTGIEYLLTVPYLYDVKNRLLARKLT